MNIHVTVSILFLAVGDCALAFGGVSSDSSSSRRNFISEISTLASGAVILGSQSFAANALDFDAFEQGLIASDTLKCNPKLDPKCIPKLTHDEALCKYGVQGAKERTAACTRVRDSGGQLPNSSKTNERSTMGWLNGDIALTK